MVQGLATDTSRSGGHNEAGKDTEWRASGSALFVNTEQISGIHPKTLESKMGIKRSKKKA
jgi:hypothetical protein